MQPLDNINAFNASQWRNNCYIIDPCISKSSIVSARNLTAIVVQYSYTRSY
jgi:hypothetical protein